MQGGLHAANTIKRRLEGKERRRVQVPRPRQRGRRRPIQRHRERAGAAAQRLPRLGGLDVRPPGLPQRLRTPRRDDDALAACHDRPGPARARLQRWAHRRGSEPARRGEGQGHAQALPPPRGRGCVGRTFSPTSKSPNEARRDTSGCNRPHRGKDLGTAAPPRATGAPGPDRYIRPDDPRQVPRDRPGRRRHRQRARHRRRRRGGAWPKPAPTSCWPPAPRSSWREVAKKVEAAGRRAIVVPGRPDRLRPHGLLGRARPRRAGSARHRGEQHGRHHASAPARYIAAVLGGGLQLQRLRRPRPHPGRGTAHARR